MERIFLSEKNVARQCNSLEKMLRIPDNPEDRRKCKKFLVHQMKSTLVKYKGRKPADMPLDKFIDLLNKKSVNECIKIYDNNVNKKRSNYGPQNIHDYERSRDREVYDRHPNLVENRPTFPSMNKKAQRNDSMPGYADGMGGIGAPISSGQGGYFTADGRMGDRMFFGKQEEPNGPRGDGRDDLERLVMERKNGYQDRQRQGAGGPMNMNNMDSNGFMNMGMDNMLTYNPNISQGGQPPQIDFSLDGGGRNRRDEFMHQMPNGFNINQMSDSFNGFQNTMPNNNNQMAQMNPMQMMQMMQMFQQMQNQQQIPMPQMGNQQQMSNNMNIGGNVMSDADMQNSLAKIQSERSSLDTQLSMTPNQKFDPTVSPHMNPNMGMQMNQTQNIDQMLMMQRNYEMARQNMSNGMGNMNNQLNSIRQAGGGVTDFSLIENLNEEQLESYIEELKKNIFETQFCIPAIDFSILQNLSSEEIGFMIKKISAKLAGINPSTIENKILTDMVGYKPKPEPTNNGQLEDAKKSELLDFLKSLKEEQAKRSASSKTESELTVHNNDLSEPQMGYVISNNTDDASASQLKIWMLNINSNEYTDRHHDYMVCLDKLYGHPLCQVVRFELETIQHFPRLTNVKSKYTFDYVFGGKDQSVHMIKGNYDTRSCIQMLNTLTRNIKFAIRNKHVVVYSESQFDMNNGTNSVLKLLGFANKSYYAKNEYIAEEEFSLVPIEKVYMFVENIDDDHSFATVDAHGRTETPVNRSFIDQPLESLSELFVKFKLDDDVQSSNYYDFEDDPHDLQFTISCIM